MGWNPNKCTGPLYHAIPIASREKKTLQIQGKDSSEEGSVSSTTQREHNCTATQCRNYKSNVLFLCDFAQCDTGRCINDSLLPGVRLRFSACYKLAQLFWKHFKSREKWSLRFVFGDLSVLMTAGKRNNMTAASLFSSVPPEKCWNGDYSHFLLNPIQFISH